MKRSTDKILVSHAGVLPRPPALLEAMRGGPSRDAEFVGMQGLEFIMGIDEASGGAISDNNPGYLLVQGQHLEVCQRVVEAQLVPLEVTWLTSRGSFESAAIEGRNNLRRADEFQAMIDVRLARDRGVTPLPMLAVLAASVVTAVVAAPARILGYPDVPHGPAMLVASWLVVLHPPV